MKLLRLKLNTDFRSLQAGFKVDFLRDLDKAKMWDFMPYCLVGRNGSGKSNILEALAAIFYHIECIYHFKPEGFEGEKDDNGNIVKPGFFEENSVPDAFELEYIFHHAGSFSSDFSSDFDISYDAHILISKEINVPPKFLWLNRGEIEKNNEQELARTEVRKFLPDYIIGYSSGENEILSLPFFKMRFLGYDEYENILREETGYSQPEGRMVFMDNQFNQAVFITNYLMHNEKMLMPIYKTVGIKSMKQFRIIIRQGVPVAKYRTDEMKSGLSREELKIDNKDVFDLTYNLQRRKDSDKQDFKAIDKLKNCATSQFYDSLNDVLYLDYFIDKDRRDKDGNLIELSQMKKAFRGNFESPFELFRAFQILLTLNLYDVSIELKHDLYQSKSLYVNETVPILPSDKRVMRFKNLVIEKDGVKDNIYSKSLSDGEHQYLHAIGICLLFKDSNSLFLLDEPETHFNPDWRASFISTLRDSLSSNEKDVDRLRDLLITSHSPFIVSDCQEENVLVFHKNEKNQIVTANRPGFNTFGASVNLITIQLFSRVDTIGDLANEKVIEFEKRINKGENLTELKDEIFKTLGDSIERTILINQLISKRKEG